MIRSSGLGLLLLTEYNLSGSDICVVSVELSRPFTVFSSNLSFSLFLMFFVLMEFFLSPHLGNIGLSPLQIKKLLAAGGLTIRNVQNETGQIIYISGSQRVKIIFLATLVK